MTTVLLAEDDAAIAEPLSRALQREGYEVAVADDGWSRWSTSARAAWTCWCSISACPGWTAWRSAAGSALEVPDLPVLMLTARTDEVDFVVGLDAAPTTTSASPSASPSCWPGSAPCCGGSRPETVEVGGVRMELSGRRVLVDGAEVGLANKEFELLRVLLLRAGQVVTREEILREVWNDPELRTSKTLDMHMSWLRRKIGGDRRIATVRGVGFRFNHD